MTSPVWPMLLARAETDGPAYANLNTKQSLLPAHAKFLCPTTGFWTVGKQLRIKAIGRVNTFTSGTLTFALDVGTVDAWASQALTMVASRAVNDTWWLDLLFTLRTVGAGGSATANGLGVGTIQAGGAIAASATQMPATAPAVGTSFDPDLTTNTIDLVATWSVANAANSIQVHEYSLEALN
jgi:hypothetical protein